MAGRAEVLDHLTRTLQTQIGACFQLASCIRLTDREQPSQAATVVRAFAGYLADVEKTLAQNDPHVEERVVRVRKDLEACADNWEAEGIDV